MTNSTMEMIKEMNGMGYEETGRAFETCMNNADFEHNEDEVRAMLETWNSFYLQEKNTLEETLIHWYDVEGVEDLGRVIKKIKNYDIFMEDVYTEEQYGILLFDMYNNDESFRDMYMDENGEYDYKDIAWYELQSFDDYEFTSGGLLLER